MATILGGGQRKRWGLALLFVAAILSSALVLLKHLPALATGALARSHGNHAALLLVHAAGGTAMLLFGSAALYIGWTRRGLRHHRKVGLAYLIGGSIGALAGLALSIRAPHEPRSLYVATGTLALVWLAVAAMAWRAARARRFDLHREWMIRSYVLSWTFVGCRLAETVSYFPALGAESVTATIWVNWIVPLVLCEFVLQWRRTGPVCR
jgi:hypothetical protein